MAIVDNEALEKERISLQDECEVGMELLRRLVRENQRAPLNQAEYSAREASLTERYNNANKRLKEVNQDIEAHNARRSELKRFLRLLASRDDLLTEFDEGLWLGIVHQMKVHPNGGVTFVLKDGTHVPNV